jgi:DNA ligase (NAD+)
MKTEIEKLAEKILHHKELYYNGEPEISDAEYDELELKLKKLNPKHPVLQIVGSVAKSSEKVFHEKKMLSLDKTYDVKDLEKWMGTEDLVSTFKIDGSSCSLIYENGLLIQAKTRGDGSVGENVTAKILWIDEIPKVIKELNPLEIRGEIYCTEENFVELSDQMEKRRLERPTSQRNIVAGFLGRKDHLELCKFLSFKAFEIISPNLNFKFEKEKFDWMKSEHFPIPNFEIHRSNQSLKKVLDEAQDFIVNGHYMIDGLVFTYNRIKLHDELGETAHHPRYKLAFKFKGEAKSTKILKIQWSVSRNGILTPVAIIEPTVISGATITNVTLHNYGMVKVHQLKKDDEIEVIRSGEVIPKFLRVIKSSDQKFTIPSQCPSCGQEIEKRDIRLYCLNSKCPEKLHADILNFIQKIEIEDLSEKRLKEMMDKNLVKDIPSLYKLRFEDLLELDKVKETLATKILNNIEKTKNVDLIVFLSALGIAGGAYNKCEKIVSNGFNTIDKIQNLTLEQLLTIEGFAEKSATDFLASLKLKKKLINELIEQGFTFKKKKLESHKLENIKVCITGELSAKRSDIEKQIKNNGGIVVSSVTKQTNYLLTNEIDSTSSKFKKAQELGTKIISEKEFNKLFLE